MPFNPNVAPDEIIPSGIRRTRRPLVPTRVSAANSQRRPGLHTEGFVAPGVLSADPDAPGSAKCRRGTFWHPWGMGHCFRVRNPDDPRTAASFTGGSYQGGVFMASSIGGSCRLWEATLRDAALVGRLGNIEHLRHTLSRAAGSCVMQANELFWMTDATPHESCPLAADAYRQYFRLVTSNVAVWYKAHSTANPLGIEPPLSVEVITQDKFTGEEPEGEEKGGGEAEEGGAPAEEAEEGGATAKEDSQLVLAMRSLLKRWRGARSSSAAMWR